MLLARGSHAGRGALWGLVIGAAPLPCHSASPERSEGKRGNGRSVLAPARSDEGSALRLSPGSHNPPLVVRSFLERESRLRGAGPVAAGLRPVVRNSELILEHRQGKILSHFGWYNLPPSGSRARPPFFSEHVDQPFRQRHRPFLLPGDAQLPVGRSRQLAFELQCVGRGAVRVVLNL